MQNAKSKKKKRGIRKEKRGKLFSDSSFLYFPLERSDLDLSYLNARIRAWKGELLNKEAYDALIGAEDAKGLITRLRETLYDRDMEIAAARYDNEAAVIEGGLRANLSDTFKRLWDYAPVSARGILRAIFSLWEIYNLKAILRARDKGISPDESISILMPAGEMDESALKELNQQKDIADILSLLSTWGSPYVRPIRDAMELYKKERRLIPIELGLDRFVHHHAIISVQGNDINRRIMKRLVKERIDSINISTLLKVSGEGILPNDIGGYFLEGGERINRGDFLKLAGTKDRKGLFQGLADSVKEGKWKKIIGAADPEEAFFIEEKLEGFISGEMCRLSVTEPLSIALAACFIYQKVREIKNLRLIVRAKIFEIPAIEVKRFII